MNIALQLFIAAAIIAGMLGLKIVAFRMLAGQKPGTAVDVDRCGEKDCIGGCGGHDGNKGSEPFIHKAHAKKGSDPLLNRRAENAPR